MKKVSLILAVFTLVGCVFDQTGNKNILPADDTRTIQTVYQENESTTSVVEESQENALPLDEAGNYIYDVGEMTSIQLPDENSLSVGAQSTENQIYNMLSDEGFEVNEDRTQGWVSLDRVYFNTGSDELTSASQAQLENILAILSAYPTSEVKFGGYTDNTGSQQINQALSEGRAKSVMNTLATLGIDASRMSAEGYGSEHPVCPANDTDVCKAQNRRVDIRITKK